MNESDLPSLSDASGQSSNQIIMAPQLNISEGNIYRSDMNVNNLSAHDLKNTAKNKQPAVELSSVDISSPSENPFSIANTVQSFSQKNSQMIGDSSFGSSQNQDQLQVKIKMDRQIERPMIMNSHGSMISQSQQRESREELLLDESGLDSSGIFSDQTPSS